MKIIFDLDGTLIDSKLRLYNLFTELVKESNLSFEDYWQLKSNKVGHATILRYIFKYDDRQIFDFEKLWMGKIENPEWLKFDRAFDGIHMFLKKLKNSHAELHLVTARQFEDRTIKQLEELSIINYFDRIFVTGQKYDKYALIKNNLNTNKEDWMVGDTGKDIETGKKLGMHTAAVLTGFLNEKQLIKYMPDIITQKTINLNFNLK